MVGVYTLHVKWMFSFKPNIRFFIIITNLITQLAYNLNNANQSAYLTSFSPHITHFRVSAYYYKQESRFSINIKTNNKKKLISIVIKKKIYKKKTMTSLFKPF